MDGRITKTAHRTAAREWLHDHRLQHLGRTVGVSSAAPGSVVCVGNGNYAKLALTATKAAPGVTVRAANPGGATIAGASLSGSNLTLARFVSTTGV